MMTHNEAVERALAIWGDKAHSVAEILDGSESWRVWLSDLSGHTLDANGHTACHPECAKLEAKL